MLNRIFQKLCYRTSHENRSKQEINSYYSRQLSVSEIRGGKHRTFVGGLWEELGILQFEFMKNMGLQPGHKLLDVGCGAMRGGLYFVDYLNAGNYYGLDINASLIEAAKIELNSAGLLVKSPHLLVNDKFDFSLFDVDFDYAVAISVFTHLDMNHILRCLVEISKKLKPKGKFYATFFEAPASLYLSPIRHHPGEITTYYDNDPFHYSYTEMKNLAAQAGINVELVDGWVHPRNQKMLCFVRGI